MSTKSNISNNQYTPYPELPIMEHRWVVFYRDYYKSLNPEFGRNLYEDRPLFPVQAIK